MKTFPILVAALLWAATTSWGAAPAGWSTNLTAALAAAHGRSQPVLLDFTADWCGPCRMMAQTTLANPAVQRSLARFATVSIDIDAHPDLAARYRVSSVPTFIVADSGGAEVVRQGGYQQADAFLGWLTNSLSAYSVFRERQRLFAEQQLLLKAALTNPAPETRRKALDMLFELCASREPGPLQFADEQLRALAGRQPEALAPGLNHTNLATRLHVANALRERLGEEFDFDPWASPAARTAAATRWRERLTRLTATH